MKKIYISGAAMVTEEMYTTLHSGTQKIKIEELFHVPPLNALLGRKSSRYGRFDQYTRSGCAAAGIAVHDAGLKADQERRIGFILAGQMGSFATDLAFYETAAGNGKFASPNLFSYTLPNIVIGECALQYGLTGPTYCLDSDDGGALGALTEAAWCLQENDIKAMLAGWLEIRPAQAPQGDEGAIVLVLEKDENNTMFQLELELDIQSGLRFPDGGKVDGIDQLVRVLRNVDVGFN